MLKFAVVTPRIPCTITDMSLGECGMNVEEAVGARYSAAARERDTTLCCPVTYDPKYLKVIPQEILEKDYGCGNPSLHVQTGDTVLDLGSGGGKMCFIVSQIVGRSGKVIGVDMNDDMLALARKHRQAVGEAIGWQNVEFRKGRIQDLALDVEKADEELRGRPISSVAELMEMERRFTHLRETEPMIGSDSVDVVISNCVLNLVDPSAKAQLFSEIFRVLKAGGRSVISDIVSDRTVPAALMKNQELWSGCIAGALPEGDFLKAFTRAGFGRAQTRQRQEKPWRVIEGIEFRSVTVEATKESTMAQSAEVSSPTFSVWPATPLAQQLAALRRNGANPDSCCGDGRH